MSSPRGPMSSSSSNRQPEPEPPPADPMPAAAVADGGTGAAAARAGTSPAVAGVTIPHGAPFKCRRDGCSFQRRSGSPRWHGFCCNACKRGEREHTRNCTGFGNRISLAAPAEQPHHMETCAPLQSEDTRNIPRDRPEQSYTAPPPADPILAAAVAAVACPRPLVVKAAVFQNISIS